MTLNGLSQGFLVSNAGNTNLSSGATSSGLVWVDFVTMWDGTTNDLSLLVYEGSSSSSLHLLASIIPNLSTSFTGIGLGKFSPSGLVAEYFPSDGSVGGTVYVELGAWWTQMAPAATTLVQAQQAGAIWGQTPVFPQPLGGGGLPSPQLINMPAFIFLPEPSTLALVSLGLGSLLLLRVRRHRATRP